MSLKIAALALAAAVLAAPAANAQNFLGMNLTALNNQFAARQNAQMGDNLRGMVASNLNNPQVMAAYRAGVCGPGLTPQQFALKYAALGGCTAQGYYNYNATSAGIAQQQQTAMAGLQGAVQNRQDAMNGLFAGQAGIANQRGMLNGGYRYNTQPNGYTYWYRP